MLASDWESAQFEVDVEQLALVEIEGGVEVQADLDFANDVDAAIEPLVVGRFLVLVQERVTMDGQYQQFLKLFFWDARKLTQANENTWTFLCKTGMKRLTTKIQ